MTRRARASVFTVAGLAAAYAWVGRPWQLHWGATAAEVEVPLPGDDLLPHPDVVATRAITVQASPGQVWPWIVQLGQGRGGFYSYDWLENLVGCRIHSAGRIVPEWQNLRVGDEVRLAPEVGLEVAQLAPAGALVLRGGVPIGSTPPPYDFTWAFVLQATNPEVTRLLVRERWQYTRAWTWLMVEPMEAISFVMHQRMLRGIRDRVAAGSMPAATHDP